MPNVLIEAMACEVPVVTTPLAGIPDLVLDGKNGLLVQERDAHSLTDALEKLILDKSMRQQLGKRARGTILEAFQIQCSTAKLAMIFRQVSKRYQNREASFTNQRIIEPDEL
jgi:glycosyltransferase involved in cell wall biosynthesis